MRYDTASTATCAAIAQILPVFLVALVAERIAFGRAGDAPIKPMTMVAALLRVVIDFAIAIALVVFTGLALTGIEREGLSGQPAERLWIGSFVLALVIVYRWVLLATPVLAIWSELGQRWGRLVVRWMESFESVPMWVARAIQVFSEVTLSFLAVGLSHGIETLAEWMSTQLSRRRQLRK